MKRIITYRAECRDGRLHFHHPDGTRAHASAGAPSVLVAYGAEDARMLATTSLPGTWVKP